MMASGATTGVPHRHSDVVQPDARVGGDSRFMVPPWCRWNHAWELCRNGVTATIRCIGDGLTTLAFRRSPPASLCDQTSACPATSVSGPGTPPLPTTGPAPSMPRGVRPSSRLTYVRPYHRINGGHLGTAGDQHR